MDLERFDEILSRTFSDRKLSRTERSAFADVLSDHDLDDHRLDVLRSRVFEHARSSCTSPESRELIDWVEDVLKVLRRSGPEEVGNTEAAAYFSPGRSCVDAIRDFIAQTRRKLSICVFTITDDRISDEIIRSDRRGVRVRILTDDEKSEDLGSDVDALARAGIPVVHDESDKHMHHKFAISDDERVLTGSYNWTRSAADVNEENVVVSSDPRLVKAFCDEFESLWAKFSAEHRS